MNEENGGNTYEDFFLSFIFFSSSSSFLVRFGCCFCHSHAVAATAAVEKARGSIRNGDADEEGVCQFVTTVRVSGHCALATSTTPNAISSSIRLVPGERLFVLLQHDNIDSLRLSYSLFFNPLPHMTARRKALMLGYPRYCLSGAACSTHVLLMAMQSTERVPIRVSCCSSCLRSMTLEKSKALYSDSVGRVLILNELS